MLYACSVRAGNPGDDKHKAVVVGVVTGIEDRRGLQIPVRVLDTTRQELTSTVSDVDGFYQLGGIPPGPLSLLVGEAYERAVTIPVGADLVMIDIVVPVPAAPVRLRSVEMGPQVFCLLWDDLSGFETSFHVQGPLSVTAPADTHGIVMYLPNTAVDEWGSDNWPTLNQAWNERFAGTYFLTAQNEYGASVSVVTHVDAYLPDTERESGGADHDIEACGGNYSAPNFKEEQIFVRGYQ
jgi:hypothetical protein